MVKLQVWIISILRRYQLWSIHCRTIEVIVSNYVKEQKWSVRGEGTEID